MRPSTWRSLPEPSAARLQRLKDEAEIAPVEAEVTENGPSRLAASSEVELRFRRVCRRTGPLRQGSAEVRVSDITILASDEVNRRVPIRYQHHTEGLFRDSSCYPARLIDLRGITDQYGSELIHFDPLDEGLDLARLGRGRHHLDFTFDANLAPGEYDNLRRRVCRILWWYGRRGIRALYDYRAADAD